MTEARRLTFAKHEAGHVIPLLALELPFKNVEIVPAKLTLDTPNFGFVRDGDDLVGGLVRMDAVAWYGTGCAMVAEDRIMQALAGGAGEQIDWKRPVFGRVNWYDEASNDMSEAEYYDDMLNMADMQAEFVRGWKLLRRYRKAHAAISAALMEKSLLTYVECVAIWEANRGYPERFPTKSQVRKLE